MLVVVVLVVVVLFIKTVKCALAVMTVGSVAQSFVGTLDVCKATKLLRQRTA